MSDAGEPEAVVVITADTSQATDQLDTLQSGFNRLETSVISTSRRAVSGVSGIMHSVSGLYDAQQRVNVAQINYTLTVREYGAGSIQAARALDQLRVAQNGVGLAQEMLNLQYLKFALSVGPAIFSTITKMMAAISGTTVANYVETASWYAKAAAIGLTIGLLTLGIGVLAGLAGGAAVNQQISQQNTFYGGGTANPNNMVDYASNSLSSSIASQSGY